MRRVVVVGVGNPYRRDDAAGLLAAERVAAVAPPGVETFEHDGEPARLIDLWDGADVAYVVDAVPGRNAGRIHRFEVGDDGVPDRPQRDSSHAVRLGDAVELARAVGRLPRRMVLYAIEGCAFGAGEGVSPAVDASADLVARAIVRQTEGGAPCA